MKKSTKTKSNQNIFGNNPFPQAQSPPSPEDLYKKMKAQLPSDDQVIRWFYQANLAFDANKPLDLLEQGAACRLLRWIKDNYECRVKKQDLSDLREFLEMTGLSKEIRDVCAKTRAAKKA